LTSYLDQFGQLAEILLKKNYRMKSDIVEISLNNQLKRILQKNLFYLKMSRLYNILVSTFKLNFCMKLNFFEIHRRVSSLALMSSAFS